MTHPSPTLLSSPFLSPVEVLRGLVKFFQVLRRIVETILPAQPDLVLSCLIEVCVCVCACVCIRQQRVCGVDVGPRRLKQVRQPRQRGWRRASPKGGAKHGAIPSPTRPCRTADTSAASPQAWTKSARSVSATATRSCAFLRILPPIYYTAAFFADVSRISADASPPTCAAALPHSPCV